MKSKICKKCKHRRLINCFIKGNGKNGLRARCNKCRNTYRKEWYRKNRAIFPEGRVRQSKEERNKKSREYIRKTRLEVLAHYSKGKMCCDCCLEKNVEFLSINHINGGGTKHREKIGRGRSVCGWLRANNYPIGYNVLCHNCNMSLGFYGYCPHKN